MSGVDDSSTLYYKSTEGGPTHDLPPQRQGSLSQWEDRQSRVNLTVPIESWVDPRVNESRQWQNDGFEADQQSTIPMPTPLQHSLNSQVPSPVRAQVVAQSYGVMCWYYIDPNGVTQGPFDDMQMQQWNENGYFTPDLMMKRGDHSDFVPLGQLFQNLQVAFQPGEGPVPMMR